VTTLSLSRRGAESSAVVVAAAVVAPARPRALAHAERSTRNRRSVGRGRPAGQRAPTRRHAARASKV